MLGVQNLQNPGNSTGSKKMSKSMHLHASNTNYSSKRIDWRKVEFWHIFFLDPVRVPQCSQRTESFFEVSYLFCPSPKASQISSNPDVISRKTLPSKWVVHLQDSCTCGFPGAISTLEFGKSSALCVCFCVFPMFLGTIFPQKTIRCSKQARYKLSEAEPLFSRALEGRQRKLGVNHPDTWWKWSCFYVVNLRKLLLKNLQKLKDFSSKCLSFEVSSMKMFSIYISTKNRKKGMDLAEKKEKRDIFSSKLRIFRILWRSWTTSLNYSRCLGWV